MWLWSIGRVQVIQGSGCVVMEHIEAGRGGRAEGAERVTRTRVCSYVA